MTNQSERQTSSTLVVHRIQNTFLGSVGVAAPQDGKQCVTLKSSWHKNIDLSDVILEGNQYK